MAPRSKIIFNVSEINAACKAAIASGDTICDSVFKINAQARPGPNGTKYMDLTATVPGKTGRLRVRISGETHVGRNDPKDPKDVAEINALGTNEKYGPAKVRDREAVLKIQKYTDRVQTEEDGITVKRDPGTNKPIYPDGVSAYYQMVEHLDNFFYNTMKERIAAGTIMERDPRSSVDVSAGVILVESVKIVSPVQTTISMKSQKNPGKHLPNPMTRIKMKCNKTTGGMNGQYYDQDTAYTNEKGGRAFEVLKYDGEPLTENNVHKIRSHSEITGIINMNAVCSSNMGISIPILAEIIVLRNPMEQTADIDDVFGDEEAPASPKTPPTSPASPVLKTAPAGDDDQGQNISDAVQALDMD